MVRPPPQSHRMDTEIVMREIEIIFNPLKRQFDVHASF